MVVGISDQDLSQKLQMDHSLALAKAVKIVHMSELVMEQYEIQHQVASSETLVN